MAKTFCPECDHMVDLGVQPSEGQFVECPNCGVQLEVISLEPLELDWAYIEPDEDQDTDWQGYED